MVFDVKNTAGKQVKVIDVVGKEIVGVVKYNSKTREVTVLVRAREHGFVVTKTKSGNQVLKAKVKIPGSKIIVDGVTY